MERIHIVTGANGYLGSHLVLELLASAPDARIVCLARADGDGARRRVIDAVVVAAECSGHAIDSEVLERIHVVEANPLVKNPGLGPRLVDGTGHAGPLERTFWHVAATVQFVESEAGELDRINTQGALNALALAAESGCASFNYISTAYVAGDRNGEVLEQIESDAPAAFSNPYELSKFNAEHRIREKAEAVGMAWRVFRPSIIVGHSRTGLSSSDSGMYKFCEMLDEFWSSLKSNAVNHRSLRLHVPERAHLNLVPVDICAKEMIAIDADPASAYGVYHVVSATTVPTKDFFAAVGVVTGAPLIAATSEALAESPLSRREVEFSRRISHYQSYICGDKHFDRRRTVEACGSDLQDGLRIDSETVLGWLRCFAKRRCTLSDVSPEARLFTLQRQLSTRFNIADHLLSSAAANHPQKTAIVHGHHEVSYAELCTRVASCARRLLANGVHSQQRIALISHDSIEHVTALLAIMHLGAVCVLINPLLAASDIHRMLAHADAAHAIADAAMYEKILDNGTASPLMLQALTAADGTGSLRMPLPAATSPLDIAFIVFTSGSMGEPKLIEHRHQDPLIASDRYAAQLLDLRTSDILFSASRTTFAFGLQNMMIALLKGATAVIGPQKLSAAIIAELIATAKPTVMFAVPTIYQYLLDDPALSERIADNSLRLCIAAGERLPQGIAKRWYRQHGIRLLDSLGSTEAFSTYLSNVADVDHQAATGKLVPGFDAVLRHTDGSPCRYGERGIMWLRGPSLSVSAHDRAAGGRFDRGWYCTNDVFSRDRDGYFHFCGRSDEMFKVAGQWVSPLDLEEVLLSHPLVREAAVTSSGGDIVCEVQDTLRTKAWIVSDAASPELADELRELCKQSLDARRYPHLVEFVAELPRTGTGKLQRAPLRRRAAEQAAAPAVSNENTVTA